LRKQTAITRAWKLSQILAQPKFQQPSTGLSSIDIRAPSTEVSAARIAAGFHYRFSTVVGEEMGRQIGVHAAKTIMQPLGSTSAR
jgi:hypothetical protein